MSLNQAEDGQALLVVDIEGGAHIRQRLKTLGIRPGVIIVKISGRAGWGPVVVRHGHSQTALGIGVSRRILVEIT